MKLVILDFFNKIFDVLGLYLVPSLFIGLAAALITQFIVRKKDRFFFRFLFFTYFALILMETVIRRLGTHQKTTDFLGFYELTQNSWYIASAVENIIMFIPFGLLAALAFKQSTTLKKMIIIAALTSAAIELIQFFLEIGEAQLLDVMLNVLGAVLGLLIAACCNNFAVKSRA